MVDEKKREFIEHVLMDGFNDLSKESRHLHLSCLKVFQMFFDSSNRYDSSTDMLQDIQKAIYLPVEADATKPLKLFPQELRPFLPPSPLHSAQSGKRHRQIVVNYQFGHRFKNYTINYSAKPVAFPGSRNQSIKAPVALNSKLSIPLTNFASQCIM
ncbi:hypothetical protein JCGZ_21393 [Jatropha curcas]|uniref:Uncharacterized protein n=2 Tax=Jatropha curcas TaxID=180498 RepID=A0A067JAY0_JATCU|nr:hypothetical protein JCGZ_21393 [Jatropha curcas]